MEAVYKNSFCMDSQCVHYFEDNCMLALGNNGGDINPWTDEHRPSEKCARFKRGINEGYRNSEPF